MSKVIRLTESDLFEVVSKVLNIQNSNNNTFTGKLDRLLEFHTKLYKAHFNVDGNHYELEKHKSDYINNLFPNSTKVIKEYNERFTNPLIVESLDVDYVDNFFGFIRENYIKQARKTLKEQNTQQPNQKMAVARQAAIPIAQSLMKAFDGAGTNEQLALQAIKKIKSKEEVFQLDKILLAYKRPNLKDYINGDLTDYDSQIYRAIWAHLGKFGVTGANYNEFLASVGKGVEAIGKGVDWLRKNGVGKFFETLRGFLNSGWGQAAQIFLDSFGVGAIAVASVWGLMTNWDLININVGGWVNFLLSALGLLTAGALGPYLAPLTKFLKPIKGGLLKILEKLMASKFGQSIIKWIPSITAGVSKASGWIQTGVTWLVEKFGKFLPANWVTAIQGATTKAITWIESLVQKLIGYSSKETSDTVLTSTVSKLGGSLDNFPGVGNLMNNPKWATTLSKLDKPTAKIMDNVIHKYAREKGWDYVEKMACKSLGDAACVAMDSIGTAFQLRASVLAAKGKGSKALAHNLETKTKEELASMTADEIKQYKAGLGTNAQKFVKDVNSTAKKVNSAQQFANQEISNLSKI